MKNEIKKIIENRYGIIPENPRHLRVRLIAEDRDFAAGRAVIRNLSFVCTAELSEYSFFARLAIPNTDGKIPLFIYLSESGDVPDRFLPMEEICDRGVGVLVLNAHDVTSDDGDFKSGIARHIAGARRSKESASKTAIWSFALLRVIEYVSRLDFIDTERLALIGHAALAPAVLAVGAIQEKIGYTFLNCPTEDALMAHRYRKGYIPDNFYLFLSSLSGAFSGRNLVVGLSDDEVCDSKISAELPNVKRREGRRYLSRGDWNYYIDFVKR